jgi:uncharacterized delta-60 repeat protein
MIKRPPFAVIAVIAVFALALFCANVTAQIKSVQTRINPDTSSARGGGGKPTPTPTPNPNCATTVGNTNSWTGAGGLDLGFGTNGFAITKVSPPGSTVEAVLKVLVQADDKLVTVGHARNPVSLNLDAVVRRFNNDGTPDTSFGEVDPLNPLQRRGYVFIDFSGGNDFVESGVIDSSGRILVTGWYNAKIARLDLNGDLDATFGTGGKIEIPVPGLTPRDIALQSNGQIVLAGADSQFVVARFNSDGSLDTTFGSGGSTAFNISNERKSSALPWTLAIQTVNGEERIVLAGRNRIGNSGPTTFALVRFRSDGSVDPSFGNNGSVLTNVSSLGDQIFDLAIDGANRIVAVGSTSGGCGGDAVIARYLENGSLDASFSGDGLLTLDIYGGDNVVRGVVIQDDGKILAVGDARSPDGTIQDLVVVRLLANGILDTAFGPSSLGGGIIATDTGTDEWGLGGIAIQADGMIVAGSIRGSTQESVLTRYWP